jgi:ribonuclease R
MVVATITRYPTTNKGLEGRVSEVLGPEGDPGVDIEVIIREHGLRETFPESVEAAAEAVPMAAEGDWGTDRRDLRGLFTVTIDPVDARDFDDAISIEHRTDGGGWRLWVHIADVSHYVPWGGPLDEEARKRSTSVYLVDRVLPMLPERLSNGICSLNPGVDRLTMTVEMDLDANAAVEDARFYPSVIRSDQRLTYGQVDAWLAGDDPWPEGDVGATLRTMLQAFAKAAKRVGQRRTDRGGLDFETVEAKVLLDDDGRPVEVVLRERSTATNMIEEAMIAANEAVARHLRDTGTPGLFRVHEDPDDDALGQVALILKEFDYPVTEVRGATPLTFQRIVRFAHTRPERWLINSLLLRALKRAVYSEELGHHFGLASDAYLHFTSPIRRYPDLVVHRMLKAQLAGTLESDEAIGQMIGELHWLAEHTSTMEREAEWAEDDSVKLKLAELMTHHIGEEYDGIVTGVTTFGIFVQLPNTAEGLVHVSAMADDHYSLDAERHLLYGERKGRTFRLGDQIRVKVVDVSVGDRRIELEVARA